MKAHFKEIIRPRRNAIKFFGLLYLWNAINLNYAGVGLGIMSAIDINPFLMFFLSSIFEGFGILVCMLNDKIGRRKALVFQLLLVGVCSMLIALLPDEISFIDSKYIVLIKVSLALVSRSLNSAAYNTIYIFVSELYDVRIRGTVLLVLCSGSSLSNLITPQINLLRTILWKPMPYFVYGITGLLSCVVILFLPETYHHNHHQLDVK